MVKTVADGLLKKAREFRAFLRLLKVLFYIILKIVL